MGKNGEFGYLASGRYNLMMINKATLVSLYIFGPIALIFLASPIASFGLVKALFSYGDGGLFFVLFVEFAAFLGFLGYLAKTKLQWSFGGIIFYSFLSLILAFFSFLFAWSLAASS